MPNVSRIPVAAEARESWHAICFRRLENGDRECARVGIYSFTCAAEQEKNLIQEKSFACPFFFVVGAEFLDPVFCVHVFKPDPKPLLSH